MVIYCIKNLLNNKKYFGLSRNFKRRAADHLKNLRGRRHPNKHLQNAYNSYGEQAFRFTVVLKCKTSTAACKFEKFYIKKYKTANPKFGYNKTFGGEKSFKFTQETLANMSNKIKEALKNVDRKGEKNSFYGKSHKTSTLKITKAKGRKRWANGVYNFQKFELLCITPDFKIKIFESINQASRTLKLSKGNISMILKGTLNHTKQFCFLKA